jgi:urea transporter/murein DD-endopeptidase MepM/ murein hydrolase activator NlpD
MKRFKQILFDSIKPYSSILFLNNTIAGVMLLAITFINPSVAISGIVSILFTLLFAYFIDIKKYYISEGFYIYNSLLVGMGIGYLFVPSTLSIILIAVSSSFTFLLSFVLNRLFSVYKIPILSLPFSIVTMFIYLASLKYSALLSTLAHNNSSFDIALPLILSGFFKSFGTILFLPHNIAGILMVLVVLYFSRIIIIMALSGFYVGVFFHSFLIGSLSQALSNPYAFNYILVAVALGGIFLLPTIKNYFISLVAVSITVILTDSMAIFFNYYSIPVFTLPFNLTVIVFIFVLSITYYKEFNYDIKATPELSLSNYLSNIFRFGKIPIVISLPFTGKWSVYQAFDGEWTHKGLYQYAYDFVKIVDDKSYKDDGLFVEDYYAFGQSITAPISGYVVYCRHDLRDNYIGEVDNINNWGNYVIIKSDLGVFVEISHLLQHSLTVHIGSYIKRGDIIAKCGNSGYSPQPHIHIQVQETGLLGAITKEFCFKDYYENSNLIFNSLPKQDSQIEAPIINKNISSKLLLVLDDSFTYDISKSEKKIGEVTFTIKMNLEGVFYFEDDDKNELYYQIDETQFYFYKYQGKNSHLKQLFILAPRIPFINKDNISYIDYLNINLVKNKVSIIKTELLSSINAKYAKLEETYIYKNETISSKRGIVTLDKHNKGFKMIKYCNIKLKKQNKKGKK